MTAPTGKDQKIIRYDASRAAGWRKWFHIQETGAQILSDRMVALAVVRPGSRVLDIATGLGEPALTAARIAGPDGRVLAIDLSPDMLDLARERAAKLGLANVDFQVMDANALALPEDSFDAALSRWGLMFIPDLDEALRRIHRCLRPGGAFSAAVWGAPEDAPAVGLGNRVVLETLGLPPPNEGPIGPFALRDTNALLRRVARAGFREVTSEWISVVFEFESPETFAEYRRDRAGEIKDRIAHIPEEDQEAAWKAVARAAAPFVTADGTVRMENRAFCFAARR